MTPALVMTLVFSVVMRLFSTGSTMYFRTVCLPITMLKSVNIQICNSGEAGENKIIDTNNKK